MKKMKVLAIAVIAMISMVAKAQSLSVGSDLVSSYVWRGVQYSGVSVQPAIDFTAGNLTVGAWGSVSLDNTYMEMDLYTSYAFDFGLTAGLTDYYYPGTAYFTGASHSLEINLGYSLGDLSLAANYIPFTGGSTGEDKYFEVGYAFKNFSVFAGAGDGWHTSDGSFGIVNVGLSTSKEIKITDSFSLPMSGSVVLNPSTEQLFFVVGVSL